LLVSTSTPSLAAANKEEVDVADDAIVLLAEAGGLVAVAMNAVRKSEEDER
jgi:hypothetical protein